MAYNARIGYRRQASPPADETTPTIFSAPPRIRPSRLLRYTSGGVYVGVGRDHWVRSKSDDGVIIILEDGSVWRIDLYDRLDTMLWLPTTQITVAEADFGYLLVNTNDGETAHAVLLRQ